MTGDRYSVTVWAVDSGGVAQRCTLGVSWGLDAALDVLLDAGVTGDRLDRWTKLLVVAENEGRDPEQFARRLLGLSRAVR